MPYQCAQAIVGWVTIENFYCEEERNKGERVGGKRRKEEKKERNIYLIHTYYVECMPCVLGIFTYLMLKPIPQYAIPTVVMRKQRL